MSEQEIILYDLPSKGPNRSWSANAWKTRFALNFKGIPYRTEWIPYIRLQETIKATGVKPNPPGSWSEYSVPTIKLPDGSYLMDSAAIVVKLESMYPTPSLHLNPSLEEEAGAAMFAVFRALIPYFMPIIAEKLVAPEDVEWFKRDRAGRFGITVEEFEKGKDPDVYYEATKAGFEKCRTVLTAHKKDDGPFILGSVPCYADFYFAATMQMLKRAGSEYIGRFLEEAGPELRALHEACEKWTVKQD